MSSLPTLFPRLLVGWLLHRARGFLGEENLQALDAALSPRGGTGPQARLRAWLQAEATAQQLLQAARLAEAYVQRHCAEADLCDAATLGFADLPEVQAALADLPQALDAEAVRAALRRAIARDFPSLLPAQVEALTRLYTEALERALLAFEPFALPLIGYAVLDLRAYQEREFAALRALLHRLLQALQEGRPTFPAEAQEVLHRALPTPPGALPPGSYLPFVRNAFFTGREAALMTLAERLTSPSPPAADAATPSPSPSKERGRGLGGGGEVITGMGGVGKTQLAVEFAYRYGYRFAGVHWLDLSDPAQLDEALARNGERMGLRPAEGETRRAFAERVLRAWKAHGPRLLILDNFEDLGQAQEVLARLQHPHLRLLLTSRRKDWPPTLGLRPLPLDEFTPEESRAFLRRWLPPERAADEALDALAARLGRLPLALELAGRYLHHLKRKTMAAYLAELERALEHPSMQGWKPAWGSPTQHDLNLARTFALSWAQVESEAARRVFVAAGYCAPDEPLPRDALDPLAGGPDALEEAFADLTALGLLREGDPPTVHPLVAEFARGLDEEGAALNSLAKALTEVVERTMDQIIRTANYRLFSPLIPHVRAVAVQIESLDADSPVPLDHAARLWNELGYYLHDLADYAGANDALKRALRIWQTNLGDEHPEVAIAWNNLGLVLLDLGDLHGAKQALKRALHVWRTNLCDKHPYIATAWNNLGRVLQDLGDLHNAKQAFQHALRIWRASLGDKHSEVATAWNNLGLILKALGDLQGAKAAIERALHIDQAAFGPNHPNIARDFHNLGAVLQDMGDLEGAKAAYKRALRIDQAAFGPDHPDIATDLKGLSRVLQDLGDLEGAKAAYKWALRIFEKFLPPEHPHIRKARENLERVERELGKA